MFLITILFLLLVVSTSRIVIADHLHWGGVRANSPTDFPDGKVIHSRRPWRRASQPAETVVATRSISHCTFLGPRSGNWLSIHARHARAGPLSVSMTSRWWASSLQVVRIFSRSRSLISAADSANSNAATVLSSATDCP